MRSLIDICFLLSVSPLVCAVGRPRIHSPRDPAIWQDDHGDQRLDRGRPADDADGSTGHRCRVWVDDQPVGVCVGFVSEVGSQPVFGDVFTTVTPVDSLTHKTQCSTCVLRCIAAATPRSDSPTLTPLGGRIGRPKPTSGATVRDQRPLDSGPVAVSVAVPACPSKSAGAYSSSATGIDLHRQTLVDSPEHRNTQLESVLGASPRGFESPILRSRTGP